MDFSDAPHTMSSAQVQQVVIDQLNSYFNEISYGKITITGQVFGWYTAPHPMSYYGRDSKTPGDDVNLVQLAQDAAALLPSSIDYSGFKYLVIVHAGKDQAADQWKILSNEIWSQTFSAIFPDYSSQTIITVGSKNFQSYSFVSELDGVGTVAHEVAHLFGIPDLYDSNNQDSFLGYWSLMDYGGWCCADITDTTPTYMGGWAAAMLGWLTPTVADTNLQLASFTLNPLESKQPTVLLIPVSTYTYYLIEYRTQTGQDSNLPISGILIYYVDESIQPTSGILKLVNPATGTTYREQSDPATLNSATFNPGDKFSDIVHQVFLSFLSSTNSITALYSPQQITASLVETNLISPTSSITIAYDSPLSLSGALREQNGKPLFNQTVFAEIQDPTTGNWKTVGSTRTDQSGTISLPTNITLDTGKYPLRIFYPGGQIGSDWYESSTANLFLNVTPASMTITISTPPITLTKQITISLTAEGQNNQQLSGVPLAISLDNTEVTSVITDAQGDATAVVTLSSNAITSHTISVTGIATDYAGTATQTVTYLPLWMLAAILGLIVGSIILLYKTRHETQTKKIHKKLELPVNKPSSMTISMGYCHMCGKKIPEDSEYCPRCGVKQS
jgi:M6 family metalloprotease-like protein